MRRCFDGHTGRDRDGLCTHLDRAGDLRACACRRRAHLRRRGLGQRATRESSELRVLLERQRTAIEKAETRLRQTDFFDITDKEQKRQVDLDLKHLDKRRGAMATELKTEPAAIEELYDVRMSRLTPVGLVVAWPELMT